MSDTVKKTQEMYAQDLATEELLAADVMAGVSALADYAADLHRNPVSLDRFCEQHGFQTEDFDRLFPEREMRQSQGGMSLG